MNGPKAAVSFLLGVAYAFSWWAAAVFGGNGDLHVLYVIPVVFSIVLLVVLGCYSAEHWDD